MKPPPLPHSPSPHLPIPPTPHLPPLRWLCVLLLLGLLFRLSYLDQKIFWVDEVATVVRAVGYTKAEIVAQLADGQIHTAADLLAYQRLTPDRSLLDSLTALSRSPEHAPLYFGLTRFWMVAFGSSIGAIRSLSVLASLLALPALGWLCRELFGHSRPTAAGRIGGIAVALLAVSPYFVAYAQEARPYSLWLLTLLLCWAALLRALRLNSIPSWGLYVVTLSLSLYTSLLTLLLLLGQVGYVGMIGLKLANQQAKTRAKTQAKARTQLLTRFAIAVATATVLFLPWIWVLLHQQQALADNTTWMRTAIHPLALLAVWLYSLAIVWFDVPVVPTGGMALAQGVLAALVLAVVGYAGYALSRSDRSVGQLNAAAALAALSLPVPLLLLLLDLGFRGQSSATSRYLIPTQMAALIAVACLCYPALFTNKHKATGSPSPPIRPRTAQVVLSGLLALSLVSNGVNLTRSPDYQKTRNQANPAIAARINQINRAQAGLVPLLAEPAQTMDLLSLSHLLDPTVPVRIAPADRLLDLPPAVSLTPARLPTCPTALLFNPSPALLAAANQRDLQPQQLYRPALLTAADVHLTLWQIACPIP
ncbi:MAG: hypothetical protein ACKO7W_10475 [Elainella sp.]